MTVPVLITDAAQSSADQLAARKRRYTLLMGSRVLLFVLAALTYPVSTWLAVGLLAASIPLPWMAVLIANDRPARRVEDAHRLTGTVPVHRLERRDHTVVDAPADGG
nr:putative membrane protein [uncultured bacterium]